MKTLLLTAQFLLTTLSCMAAGDEAVQAAKAHVGFLFAADFEHLGETYAKDVLLMPGHEFLKPQYGIAQDMERKLATSVESKRLIEVLKKKLDGRPKPAQDRVNARFARLKFESLPVAEGDFATEPTDNVATPDGKLHFTLVKGDVVLKVSPPKGDFGDFLLLHLRSTNGKWQVVSEYLD